jgi:hypothetical protein
MVKRKEWIVFALVTILLPSAAWMGCGLTETTIYMQNLAVTGPVNNPPVHVTSGVKRDGVTISPHFTGSTERLLTGQIAGHTMVDPRGAFQVDTVWTDGKISSFKETPGTNTLSYAGSNFRWDLPASSFGVDMDFTFSGQFAFSAGLSYGSGGGEGFWGGHTGLGILFGGKELAGRLEGGLVFQTLSYHSETVVITRTSQSWFAAPEGSVYFYADDGRTTSTNVYAALTVNSRVETWAVNLFVNIAVSTQTVANIQPQNVVSVNPLFWQGTIVNDARTQDAATFFIFTPGIYVNIWGTSRFLAGVRVASETELMVRSPGAILEPLLQLDIGI